jgi:hypothetical protein
MLVFGLNRWSVNYLLGNAPILDAWGLRENHLKSKTSLRPVTKAQQPEYLF